MPVVYDIQFDAESGRHRLEVINQQADHLGLVAFDASKDAYVYIEETPGAVSHDERTKALDWARAELPERDLALHTERANEHLVLDDGILLYAAHVEALPAAIRRTAMRGWQEALEGRRLGCAPARLREAVAKMPLAPRPRVLCEDTISALARHRVARAEPILVELWQRGQRELRQRAGLALSRIATPKALDVLSQEMNLPEPLRRLAIIAVFTRDPRRAFEHLEPLGRDDDDFLRAVLDVLCRDAWDDGRPHWGACRRWFEADPRWLALVEPLAQKPQRTSTTDDPPNERIAALAYELVQRRT